MALPFGRGPSRRSPGSRPSARGNGSLATVAVDAPITLARPQRAVAAFVSPSATLRPPLDDAWRVFDDLGGKIDAILDAGPTFGIESTILGLRGAPAISPWFPARRSCAAIAEKSP